MPVTKHSFQNQIPWVNLLLRQLNIPKNVLDQVLIQVIQITLNEIGSGGQQPGRGWIGWENLGGGLTSAPGVSSWQPNRLDVFGRGTDQALYHKWWDGRSWSNWENLGGVLTSGPTVSSRRPNHLEVFVRGTNQRMYTRTWNGSRWVDWEDLGGKLTSAPAAVSWGPNWTDVFANGENDNLIHLYRGR